MRVSTAFNRLLQIPGAWVTDVVIAEGDVEVTLRPKARLLRCPVGVLFSVFYNRRRRRWRHLDLGRYRLWLVFEIRRVECPDCGVRTEELPWARPGARHTHQRWAAVWLTFSTTCRADRHGHPVALGHPGKRRRDSAAAGVADGGHPVEPPDLSHPAEFAGHFVQRSHQVWLILRRTTTRLATYRNTPATRPAGARSCPTPRTHAGWAIPANPTGFHPQGSAR
ncbi:hypothetical protein MSHI_25150 [Mycobacterium shinjukuense]|uniref:Transposase IS204/IS1001/IS1096/IS1165 zinc-finger domain-containing protein n=1 Tax=Mycobacterium shinjukuense TaxID=398694 RepID=A0A7I7MTP3_9MYCO|nr:hypothetical protein MSHI_25150 [Mycobacterium shinjukuense]